jgi:phosphatidylglycerophosphate synthase
VAAVTHNPVRWVHPPTVGVLGGVALLATLAATTGLGVAGWLAGVAFLAGTWALLTRARRRSQAPAWSLADTVTLGRATLVGVVTALVAESFVTPVPVAVLVATATVALLLDAVDGLVARRTGTCSQLGARFDMETDAFLVLILAIFVAASLGWWVVAVGAARYLFVAAGYVLPWLRKPVPGRRTGKVVAAVQGATLVTASAAVVPRPLMVTVLVLVLALLAWSFGYDVARMWRARHDSSAAAPASSGTVTVRRTARQLATHRTTAWTLTTAACLLLVLVLTVPNQIEHLTPVAFLRIPAEGLLAAAVLLALPARRTRAVAAGLGAMLGLLAVLRVVDMGFFTTLARPFDPVLDWPLLRAAIEFLTEAAGRPAAVGAVAAAVLLAGAMVALTALAAARLARPLVRHRLVAAGVVAVLAVVWGAAAVLDVHVEPGVPVASHEYERAVRVSESLQDRRAFAAEAADDAFRHTPPEELLTALRGTDVVIVYVESYGRDALTDPEIAAQIAPVLASGQDLVAEAGFAARSAYLTAPVIGGGSWLTHATLRSGVWVDNTQRYQTLAGVERLSLTGAFQRAGWRTVGFMPAMLGPWPEGRLFGFERVYGRDHLGYEGPRMNWGKVPDQYTLSALERFERASDDRAPLMAEIVLVSSHTPWTPVAPLVDWDDVGDGSVFDTVTPWEDSPEAVARDRDRARAAYVRALTYSLESVLSYVATYGDDDLVVVMLGDHQPPPVVTGPGAGADVPVSILAADPAVLDRVAGWEWQEGLTPDPDAPVWRMDEFRDRFLTAFGPSYDAG